MRGGDAKPRRTRRSRSNLPKLSQEKLLDAVASEGPDMHVGSAIVSGVGRRVDSPDKELPPSYSAQSQVSDLEQETKPLQSEARQPDSASEIHSLPAKRVRSTWTNTRRPRVESEKAEQAAKIGSDVNDNKHQLKRVRLTRKNLALFNKMAKKKGANKASASASLEFTVMSSGTMTTSTTSSGFAIRAEKNGMLDPLGSKPPTNLEDIQKRHARSRETASPTESAHQDYVYIVGAADNEATIVVEVNPRLLKSYEGRGYRKTFNQQFTGFPKDVGFNNGLSAPRPDFVEGLDMREYDPFPVDQHVRGAVLCKDNRRSLTLPHLAGEWKGRGKDMGEAGLQSSYDGAALVYARNQALSYIGKPDPPGHAEVTTFTTDGTNLNFFAHYAAPSEDGTLKYHQYPYASVNLKKYQEFKEGRRGLRNEQDHARKQSYALRDQLKEHWKQRRGDLNPIAKGAPPPILDGTFEETNADEDEAGHEVVE